MAESRTDRRLRRLRDESNANFTIICQGRKWQVDKGILAAESEFFDKLCCGGFDEANENRVSFPDQEPEVVDQVLVYLYTCEVYDDLAVISCATTSQDAIDESKFDVEHLRDTLEPIDSTWTSAQRHLHVHALEAASKEETTKVLVGGILVYQCAVMMGLVELQMLATQRLMEKERYFIRSDLSFVLETLFNNTRVDDPLRLRMLARCIENYDTFEDYPGAVRVLKEYEYAAWELGTEYFAAGCKHETEKKEHEAKNLILLEEHKELSKLREQLLKLKNENTEYSEEVYDLKCRDQIRDHDEDYVNQKHIRERQQDLSDITYAFENHSRSCSCGQSVVGNRVLEDRDGNGRLQYACRGCQKKCLLGALSTW